MPQGPLAFYNSQFTNLAGTSIAAPQHVDAQGAVFTGNRHGKYYEGAYYQTSFMAANQSGVTTTVGLATTYVGICLSNPFANTKNFAIHKVTGAITVAATAETLVALAVGFNSTTNVTHTTALVVQPAGAPGVGASSVAAATGKVDSSATLPTAPVYVRQLTQFLSAGFGSFSEDVDGAIILPPGGYLIVATSAAGGTSGFWGSISWDELPQ